MSVVTYTFIVFLLCTIVLYYIVPKKIQWVILLLASLVFYGYAGIEYLFLVIATAVVVYLFSLRLQKSLDEQEELAKDPAFAFICYIDANYVAKSTSQGIAPDTVMGHHGVGIFWNVADWTIEE